MSDTAPTPDPQADSPPAPEPAAEPADQPHAAAQRPAPTEPPTATDPPAAAPSPTDPQAAAPPPTYPPAAAYPPAAGYPPTWAYPEPSRGVLVLVLGLVALLMANVVGPVAWWLGLSEQRDIAAGRRPPTGQGQATAGMVLGIIATASLALGAVVVAVVLVVVFATGLLLLPIAATADSGELEPFDDGLGTRTLQVVHYEELNDHIAWVPEADSAPPLRSGGE